ncbi:hypothetical protein EMIHUDRAFT_198189 [Emiliania huxleyi CCMP1516]|uniref:Exostosin GT47 domain-containing protein n=2 Tax=Emiliania huxleyi TaxID=2903 RepID=A0A0D3IEE8_EMIH1|nr:hypothetical protein EMIHUDRAFT_198189 [Emiliania huxleyi CCMP1516]EOD09633.1 hypothetical protein EMIHUDRAFT_198189 [Emiliania huxleyi CCMP1516]|eukprot:XP_005762062.1 hypothetical protein EMIHUDRAFT_198189 [Emiliania huxleyi CCMP1516]
MIVTISHQPLNNSLLLGTNALLPAAIGHFRLVPSQRPDLVQRRNGPELMLPVDAVNAENDMELSMRLLLGITGGISLNLHVFGRAAAVAQLLKTASGAMRGSAVWVRSLRRHFWAASAIAPRPGLESALRRAFPGCARPAADLLALLAPSLLSGAETQTDVILVDPMALLLSGAAELWRTLRALPRPIALAAAADYSAFPPPHGGEAFTAEPSLQLLRPARLRHQGLAAYAPCNHEIEHVAFAWHAKAAHEADYAGRRCACSQRLRLLLPPGADAAAATGFGSKLRATLRKLTLEPSVLVWANRYLSLRPPPPHVAVLLDRTQQPPGYVALPLSEELSEDVSEDGKGGRRSPAPLQPHEGGAGVQVIYPCGHAGAEEHFILQTLLGACSPTRHCLFPLALAAGDLALIKAVVVPGAVFVLQRGQFSFAYRVAAAAGVPTSALILVHISDGNIYRAAMASSTAHYPRWRAAFRQYWVADAPLAELPASAAAPGDHPGRDFAPTLQDAADGGHVSWIPIGMNPQWVRLSPSLASRAIPLLPASARRLPLTFLGSTDKSDRLQRIGEVNAVLATLDAILPEPLRVFHRRGSVACYGEGCADERYVNETLESRLCLQLPGSSVESNRLYEQLEGGCVPTIVEEWGPGEAAVGTTPTYGAAATADVRAAFAPLTLVTGTPPPFITVPRVSDLPTALAPLLASHDALDALQARVVEWWGRAKRHYADAMESAVCPPNK